MRAGVCLMFVVWAGCVWSQVAAPRPAILMEWSFDIDLANWQSTDPNAILAVTNDANVTRGPEHGGVLEYAYTPAAEVFSAVLTPIRRGFMDGANIRFWLKTSEYAVCLCAANEEDGSNYHAAFISLPNRWQEIAIDFSEFILGDDSQDENGRLDPTQIRGLGLVDMSAFLAQVALQQPFIIAPELGPRFLWVDDFQVSTEPVPSRWEVTEIDGKRAIRLDSFERAPLQWMVIAGRGVQVEYDSDFTTHGNFSLRLQYDLPPGKLIGVLTSLQGVNLTGMKVLKLWLLSEVDTTLIVALKETDESNYHMMVELPTRDELAPFTLELAEFELSDDSVDENHRLDVEQIKELTIGDISALTTNIARVNTLWIDDVTFIE
ncbi:MAG: hypothetical protein ACUVX8_15350 [Candidatus Zipacnadales bacterium]